MSNNYYKEMVRLADSIADKAHEGQTDRNGWYLYLPPSPCGSWGT